jgi:flagellar biosynthesis protein FlhF
MRVRKFVGPNSRACLRDVRNALGADAVVLSSRNVAGGVEILAIAARDMAAIVAPEDGPSAAGTVRPWQPPGLPVAPRALPATARREMGAPAAAARTPAATDTAPAAGAAATAPARPAPVDAFSAEVKGIKALIERELAELAKRAERPADAALAGELKSVRALLEQQLAVLVQAAGAQKQLAAQARLHEARAAAVQTQLAEQAALAHEVKSMRAVLQRELAQFAWGETLRRSPLRADVHRCLIAAGYDAGAARAISAELPDDFGPEGARGWLQDTLERRLPLAAEDEIVERGGIFALVGPTGVGKTTTAAKIAARCAVRFGAKRLALVTTDGYRVGAHDHLRVYGKILGVPVQSAQDPAALAALVEGLRDRHLVLVDTVGMGQRDARLAETLAALDAAGVRRLLLLNAANQPETLEDVVRAWTSDRLAGCVLTKIDEAVKLGPALACLLRHGLRLHYVANGQRVPEDLHVPNARYLVHRSLRAATAAAQDEFAAVAPGGAHASA